MSRNDERLIWERPEPTRRPAPAPLSREGIVRTALAIADAEGLDAVTLRRVASELGAGPMRLYGFLSTKEELLDLMVDAVYAEALAGSGAVTPWRREVDRLAQAMRKTGLRRLWFTALLGGRPHQGPNALAYLEAMLAALNTAAHLNDIDAVLQAAKVVNAYVLGAILSEANEAQAVRNSGLNKAQWQTANWPYLERMIATGQFPTLAAVVRDASFPASDAAFDDGLKTVLDGVAAT
jgi:AcrR family transcriptional regulator